MKLIEISSNGQTLYIKAIKIDQKIWIHFRGSILTLPYPAASTKTTHRVENLKKSILSPMPGRVLKIFVKSGDLVQKSQSLLVLSAMKMEYTLKAPANCQIQLVKIKTGDLVSADQELIKIDTSNISNKG